jgi:hypothetical protein
MLPKKRPWRGNGHLFKAMRGPKADEYLLGYGKVPGGGGILR